MIDNLLCTNHGVVSTAQLVRIGVSDWDIRRLVARGRLTRLRQGWFAMPTATKDVRSAVTRGGTLSCISALKLHGLWTPPFTDLHLRRSKRHRKPIPHCRPYGLDLPIRKSVDPIGIALLAAARCRPASDAIVLLDSALNLKKVTEAELVDLFANQPPPAQRLLSRIDDSGSGTETYVRLRLRHRSIKLRPQVEIAEVGRVDFLIGERLVLEVDSYTYHENREAFRNDRRRDRALRRMGYHVVRLTYEDVMDPKRWAAVEADLLVMIRRGDHYWPRHRAGVARQLP